MRCEMYLVKFHQVHLTAHNKLRILAARGGKQAESGKPTARRGKIGVELNPGKHLEVWIFKAVDFGNGLGLSAQRELNRGSLGEDRPVGYERD